MVLLLNSTGKKPSTILTVESLLTEGSPFYTKKNPERPWKALFDMEWDLSDSKYFSVPKH